MKRRPTMAGDTFDPSGWLLGFGLGVCCVGWAQGLWLLWTFHA